MPKYAILDSAARAREKQASRDADATRLESGEVSRGDLKRENDFFSAFPLHNWKIVAIGGQPVSHQKRRA